MLARLPFLSRQRSLRALLGAVVAILLVACRPAAAEEVAAVMLLQGEVTVTAPDGTVTPAAVGLALSREDVVATAEEAAVVLHLHNNHLVRIDEDLELRIADIVLLGAPPQTMDVRAQLDDLLYDDERTSMAGVADAERVAGWHARLTAGTAPPSVDEPQREEAKRATAPIRQDAKPAPSLPGRPAAPPAPSAEPAPSMEVAPEPAPEPEPVIDGLSDDLGGIGTGKGSGSSHGSGGGFSGAPDAGMDDAGGMELEGLDEAGEEAAEVLAPAESPAAADSRVRDRRSDAGKKKSPGKRSAAEDDAAVAPADVLAAELAGPSTLRACLEEWIESLPVEVHALRIEIRLEEGRITRVIFDQGLAPPRCVRDHLVGIEVGADQQTVYTVTFD